MYVVSSLAEEIPGKRMLASNLQLTPETVNRMNLKLALHRDQLSSSGNEHTAEPLRRLHACRSSRKNKSPFTDIGIVMESITHNNAFGLDIVNYNVGVTFPNGAAWTVTRRYREFCKLHKESLKGMKCASRIMFPTNTLGIARKSIKSKASRALHYEQRRIALGTFLRQLMRATSAMAPALHFALGAFLSLTTHQQSSKRKILDLDCRAQDEKIYVKMKEAPSSFRFDCDLSVDSVYDLKVKIQHDLGTPLEQQRLVHNGRRLNDSETLSSAGLVPDCAIHLTLEWLAVKAATSHRNATRSPTSGGYT